MTRETQSAFRARNKATEGSVAAAVAEVEAADKAKWDAVRATALRELIAERARVPFTRDDLEGAIFVRDQFKWHKVVRVNSKSVTVETNYSWDERIPVDRILGLRRAS